VNNVSNEIPKTFTENKYVDPYK